MSNVIDVRPEETAAALDDRYIVYALVMAQLGEKDGLLGLSGAELARAAVLFKDSPPGSDMLANGLARTMSEILEEAAVSVPAPRPSPYKARQARYSWGGR